MKKHPLLIVISGPSGVGKDSVLKGLKGRDLGLHFVVTATNRAPRPAEQDGIDYFFVSTDAFIEMIEADALIEYAQVYNDYKGVPKAQLRGAFASGKDVIMRVDVQGASTLRAKYPGALLIYLTASEEDLRSRLRARGDDDDDALRLRVAMARKEINRLPDFDYIVENADGKLEETIDSIVAIVRAEHLKVAHREVSL
ncbi:MAG TPA: guanylate kinase [Anaerolineales bacterium]|nr:guanylate kinase [Anaerolineales bacterium]